MRFIRRVIIAVCILAFAGIAGSGSVVAKILSVEDAKIAKAAFTAADQGRWEKGLRLAEKATNPLVLKTFKWFDYSRINGVNSFTDIAAFMAENPDWPEQYTLARRAEESMNDNLAPQTVLDWFENRRPNSTDGKIQLIRALMAVGRTDEAKVEIRNTWINSNFGEQPEKTFYKRYQKYLSAEDNLKRLDRLLWEGRDWPSRRMIWKVKSDYRPVAEARLMLRQNIGNVDKAISRIAPKFMADPGLTYERLRWRNRKGYYESAVELLTPAPDNLVRADLWWDERASLARMALEKGHISDAYRIVADHRLEPGHDFAEAEWLAGWISLRFLEDAETALKHFVAMYEAVNYPISRARGAYWVARSAEALKDQQKADTWYTIAAAWPTVYYGQLAASRLGPGHGLNLPEEISIPGEEAALFNGHELHKVLNMLVQIDEIDRLKPFALGLAISSDTASWRKMSAELAHEIGRPDLSISIAKKSSRDGTEIMDTGYPKLTPPPLRTRSAQYKLEKPLVLAIIRQESAFYSVAQSHADARGLMQLMPATAKYVAQQLGIPYSKKRLTEDPQYNMLLGQTYLAGLIDEFEGSYVLSLAAYNAGPTRARKWSRMNGTPGDKGVDNVDWIEMIPITETRNYVQRVLENLQVYRLRMSETEVAETLENDLSR